MNNKDIVEQISIKTGLTQKKVYEVLDTFCDLTGSAMKEGDSINILFLGQDFPQDKRSDSPC